MLFVELKPLDPWRKQMRDWTAQDFAEARERGEAAIYFNIDLVREFHANKGVVHSNVIRDAGGEQGPAPLLILTSVGARSLKPRMRPLGYAPYDEDGERKYIIVASRGGSDKHPNWYYNLVAHPDAIIEVGEDTFRVRANLVKGDVREKVFAAASVRVPAFAQYQTMTSREIPVFLLEVVGLEFGPEL
jgi:deazaflavin-dependent oxidoreductase (nitroreductase family)